MPPSTTVPVYIMLDAAATEVYPASESSSSKPTCKASVPSKLVTLIYFTEALLKVPTDSPDPNVATSVKFVFSNFKTRLETLAIEANVCVIV